MFLAIFRIFTIRRPNAVLIKNALLLRPATSCSWVQAYDQSSTLPRIALRGSSHLHSAAQALRDLYHHNTLAAFRVVADVSAYVLFARFDGRQDFEVRCPLVFSMVLISISSGSGARCAHLKHPQPTHSVLPC